MKRPSTGVLLQSVIYLASGINHFANRGFYLRIMPDHYTHPASLVALSGVAELAGGAGLLIPSTRRPAAAGLGLMLLVFLDVHLFMIRHPERYPGVPRWVLWARIPLQFVLIGWAWRFAKKNAHHRA